MATISYPPLPGPKAKGKLLMHRVWYVGTGRMRLEKAREFVEEFKSSIREQHEESVLKEEFGEQIVFYDIFIPCPGSTGSDIAITVIRPDDNVVHSSKSGNLENKYNID